MPEKTENNDSQPDNELTPVRTGAGGILILVFTCAILWALFTFGPKGADWLTGVTQAAFGLSEPTAEEPEAEEKPAVPEPEIVETEEPAPAPIVEKQEPVKATGNPIVDNARKQIVEALGGIEKVTVRHVAISSDETSLVAAVQMLPGSELLEIYFDKDDFGRYISTPDSPVEKEIKIWIE